MGSVFFEKSKMKIKNIEPLYEFIKILRNSVAMFLVMHNFGVWLPTGIRCIILTISESDVCGRQGSEKSKIFFIIIHVQQKELT